VIRGSSRSDLAVRLPSRRRSSQDNDDDRVQRRRNSVTTGSDGVGEGTW
jgi:hypothetical protein